jgi:nucleotide-binding universal stress UspA family protein
MTTDVLLVPLDGSSLATAALPYAEALARVLSASIRLIAVVEPAPVGLLGRPSEVQANLEQANRQRLGQHVSATADALRARGLEVTVTLDLGDPSSRILAVADMHDVTMIVMATHGRGGAARWLVGSVADKIMRLSTRPVLLVRPPEDSDAARTVRLARLLVPLDGSPLGEMALPLAERLAAAAGATLTLVRVEPWLATVLAPYGAGYDLTAMDAEAAAAAEAYLRTVQERLPAGVHADSLVLRGPPSPTLIDFVQREHFDLVIMSTHGWGGLRRLVLGSTADRMVRAGIPTLLVRATGKPPAATEASQTEEAQAEVR